MYGSIKVFHSHLLQIMRKSWPQFVLLGLVLCLCETFYLTGAVTCGPGEQWDEDKDACERCSEGFYQDKENHR